MKRNVKILAFLLMLVLVVSVLPAFEAQAAVSTDVVVYYEYGGKWLPVSHKEVSVPYIIHELTGADTSGLTEDDYAHVFTQHNVNGGQLGDAGHLFDVRIDENDYVNIKPFGSSLNYIQGAAYLKVALFPYEKDGEGNYRLDANGNKIVGAQAAYEFTVRTSAWNYHYLPAAETLHVLFQDDTFYTCTANGEIIDQLPCISLMEVAATGWNTYRYNNIKILMDDTYQAGYDRSQHNDQLESLYPAAGQSLLIERFPGFTDPLIQVNYNPASTFDIGAGVTIDNKSGDKKDLTAIKIVKSTGTDDISYGGLMIFRGTLKDSDAEAAGEYRGTGVLLVSDSDTKKPTKSVERGEGGILELEDGCTIQNFKVAVEQFYGTTALTYRTPGTSGQSESHKAQINLTNNERSIVLYHHNRIEKWSTFALGFPDLKIYLEEIDQWESGDIVLASGYEWRKNPAGTNGSKYPQDYNDGYDHYWTPVREADKNGITFSNGSNLQYAMGLDYYNPYSEDFNNADWFKNWDNIQFQDPYPVIRFTRYTVYNVNKGTWYFTLGEAVVDSSANDELVFYGNTQESGTVVISHNLTIRSSYKNEESKGMDNATVFDERAGGDYTATWVRTNGSGISIQSGATVNFVGKDDVEKDYGTLTLDADGKGRVIEMWGGTTMNMEDGITLTNGSTPTYGGAVWNVNGTLNITGGTISNNSAGLGDGIYQDGTFNLSGAPVFAGQADEDVYLPASATSDTDSEALYKVITKAGEFTFTEPITVTLGNGNPNYYDGRNVVESSDNNQVVNADLAKFTLTNASGFDNDYFNKFEFIFTEKDATPNNNKDEGVLELDIEVRIKLGTLKVTKNVVAEYAGDTLPDDSFSFTVTGPNYTRTFVLKNGATEVIADLPVGEYTIVENLEAGSKYTSDWSNNTKTVTIKDRETTEVTCTNTYAKQTGNLNITKIVTDTVESGQTFVFYVYDSNNTKVMTVVIPGQGSVTINDLPVGNYTVKEDTSWSQRYDAVDEEQEVTVTGGVTAMVTFENELDETTKWLSGDSYCENWWGGNNGVVERNANNAVVQSNSNNIIH